MAKEVELTFYGDVGGPEGIGAAQFRHTLSELVNEETEIVKIRMMTYGGIVREGNGIIDCINEYRNKYGTVFIGINDSYVASMGTIIMLAMDKVWGTPLSEFHTHGAWTWAVGNADDLRDIADSLEKTTEPFINALMAKTGRTREEVVELMESEKFLTVKESIEFGLADKIYTGEPSEEQIEVAKDYLNYVLTQPESEPKERTVNIIKQKFGG